MIGVDKISFQLEERGKGVPLSSSPDSDWVKIKGGRSDGIIIRKMFNVERKELTVNIGVGRLSPVNILQFGYDKYPG